MEFKVFSSDDDCVIYNDSSIFYLGANTDENDFCLDLSDNEVYKGEELFKRMETIRKNGLEKVQYLDPLVKDILLNVQKSKKVALSFDFKEMFRVIKEENVRQKKEQKRLVDFLKKNAGKIRTLEKFIQNNSDIAYAIDNMNLEGNELEIFSKMLSGDTNWLKIWGLKDLWNPNLDPEKARNQARKFLKEKPILKIYQTYFPEIKTEDTLEERAEKVKNKLKEFGVAPKYYIVGFSEEKNPQVAEVRFTADYETIIKIIDGLKVASSDVLENIVD